MGKYIVKLVVVILGVLVIPVGITMLCSRTSLPGIKNQEAKQASGKIEENDTTYTMDKYIMMALAGTIDLSMDMETLKAQAIIIRTTIYDKMQQQNGETITLDSLGLSTVTMEELKKQVSIEEYSTVVSNLENAVYSTKGKIMTYEGKPIKALFHYANAGKTRSYKEAYGTEIPYLCSVKSEKDLQAEVGISTKEFKKSEVLAKLKTKYTLSDVNEDNLMESLTIKEKEEGGYVHMVVVGKVEIPGETFASIFGLNSTNFYFEEKDGTCRIVCKGKGSGIGFSQYGAQQMIKEGKTCEDALTYYYPGIQITVV